MRRARDFVLEDGIHLSGRLGLRRCTLRDAEDGSDELVKADETRIWIPRKPQQWRLRGVASRAEGERLARFHADLPELHASGECIDHIPDHIVVTDGDPAAADDDVRRGDGGLVDVTHRTLGVLGDWKDDGLATVGFDE